MLFAGIRGSSALAKETGPKDFSDLINHFFVVSTRVLTKAGAMIEKLVDDEITAIFSRGMSGEDYIRVAIEAAKELLRETGHTDDGCAWVHVEIGIHFGEAFVGSVGKPDGIMEVAALGKVPNTASRLTSMAGPGEILVSENTVTAARMNTQGLEKRRLELRGHNKKITAFVLHS